MKRRPSTKLAVVCFVIIVSSPGTRILNAQAVEARNPKLKSPFTERRCKDDHGEGLSQDLSFRWDIPSNSDSVRGLELTSELIHSKSDNTTSQICPPRRGRVWEEHLSTVPDAQLDAPRAPLHMRRAMSPAGSYVSCPFDFQGMRDFPWFVQSCRTNPDSYNSTCCPALVYALGQAEAEHLKLTGEFRVKDQATFEACMETLTMELNVEGANDTNIVPTCFPRSEYFKYVSAPSHCQGIMTRSDFEVVIGHPNVATMDKACWGSLVDPEDCQSCIIVTMAVINGLNNFSPSNDDCSVYTLFYVGGISNSAGPYAPATARCIFRVDVSNPVDRDAGFALDFVLGGLGTLLSSSMAVILCAWRRFKNGAGLRIRDEFEMKGNVKDLEPAMRPNVGLVHYSLKELEVATKHFSRSNYIGSGGFGDVYKGVLEDGLVVAVKRLKNCAEGKDAELEFINEVNMINSVRHKSLIVLRGCCVSSKPFKGHQRLLVYDYMPNGSLYDYLFGKGKRLLTWPKRRRLAIDVARGIAYLHKSAQPPIIHRDIKSANILLDGNLNARVADFGLAKFTIEGQTHVFTAAVGTMGYVDPEYVLYDQISEKSDVYSFGVVLLEIMSGKRALEGCSTDHSGYTLITDWARATATEGTLFDVVDERIRNAGPRDVMENFVLIAMLCCNELGTSRPSMEEALVFLESGSPPPGLLDGSVSADIIYLLHSGFSSLELESGLCFARSTSNNSSVRGFSGGSADLSPVELLR